MEPIKGNEEAILFFVRSPEPGKVKTRLQKILDAETIVTLYTCFVKDTLDMLGKRNHPPIICYYPETAGESVKSWLGEKYAYYCQRGADIGEKMNDSFLMAFQNGFSRAVLIGSDIPDLGGDIIEKAMEKLTSFDAVIGPCLDGGYYLIGFNRKTFLPRVFKKISWSGPEVFDQTMNIFSQFNYTVYRLPRLNDIDEFEDLVYFWEKNKNRYDHSRTLAFLEKRIFHNMS